MIRFYLSVSCALLMGVGAFAQQVEPPQTEERPASGELARNLSQAFADVYEKVSPGVVVIEVQTQDPRVAIQDQSGLFQFFLQDPNALPRRRGGDGLNQGSGFVMTKDGYILTNSHVIDSASEGGISVTLRDGRKFPAELVGVDSSTDLAVLKIEADDLVPVELGDSDKVRVGEFAFAIGAPFDLRYTFTYGIISAKGRNNVTSSRYYEEYIQTDASINPGNSGGPLVDIEGRVVGVNTLINGINRGLGFAIPINMAKKIASQLITNGRAAHSMLGIEIVGVDEWPGLRERFPDLPEGILVEDFTFGSPAARSNLQRYDIITKVDGVPVKTARDLQKQIAGTDVGQEVVLDVWRDHHTLQVRVRTADRDGDVMQIANTRLPRRENRKPAESPTVAGLATKTVTADLAIAMKLQAEEGAVVTHVEPGSPADVAGIQTGDVITSIDSKPVTSDSDVQRLLNAAEGEGVLVNFTRGDRKTYAILKL